MTRRFEKRKKKYLGSRNCGGGNTKNRRGKGCRGGRGMYAGSHKQRWTYIVKYEPDHFGKHGFSPIIEKEEMDKINVGNIYSLAKAGKLEKKGALFYMEFDGKVLGAGEIKLPVMIKAKAFSEGAKEKIEKANGKCELIEIAGAGSEQAAGRESGQAQKQKEQQKEQ